MEVREHLLAKKLLDKFHVVNFAPESHGFIDDDVFMTTRSELLTRSTSGVSFQLDFTLSGVDASIVASTDSLFLFNGTRDQFVVVRQTVKIAIHTKYIIGVACASPPPPTLSTILPFITKFCC